jgi:hypothetical protein
VAEAVVHKDLHGAATIWEGFRARSGRDRARFLPLFLSCASEEQRRLDGSHDRIRSGDHPLGRDVRDRDVRHRPFWPGQPGGHDPVPLAIRFRDPGRALHDRLGTHRPRWNRAAARDANERLRDQRGRRWRRRGRRLVLRLRRGPARNQRRAPATARVRPDRRHRVQHRSDAPSRADLRAGGRQCRRGLLGGLDRGDDCS